METDDGFFAQRSATSRSSASAASVASGSRIPEQRRHRSPALGIIAGAMVAAGVLWTLFAGNLGGLIGVPVMLVGASLGVVAAALDRGRSWGLAAVLGTVGVVAITVLAELLRYV
jgi:hypothetical protein